MFKQTFFPHKMATTNTVGDDKSQIQRDINSVILSAPKFWQKQEPNIRILIHNWTLMVNGFQGKKIL